MNGRTEKKSLSLASRWAKDGEWGWARETAKGSKSGSFALQAAEAAAVKAIPSITESMKGKPEDWIPKWAEFWRVHGGTEAAKPLVEAYLAERARQRGAAREVFLAAQALLRSRKKEEGLKIVGNLREEFPHTYQAFFANRWLAAPNDRRPVFYEGGGVMEI